MNMPFFWKRLSVPLLLVLVPCLAHLPELAGWRSCNPLHTFAGLTDWAGWFGGTCVVDGNVGNTVQALGGRSAELWLHGQIPWWDSLAGAGLPLAASMQPGALFLPFVLLLHLTAGPLALKLAMQILSGLFCFAFLREIGLLRAAALMGGLLFSLNGSFAYFGDAPVMPIAFLPLLLLGIERCADRSQPTQGIIAVAVAICFSLLAGFPETALVDGLFGFCWLVLRLCRRGATLRQRLGLALRVIVGGCVGLALAGPQLIPFLRLLPDAFLGPHAYTRMYPFRTDQLAGLLFPTIFGAPFQDLDLDAWGGVWGYFGATTTLLALASLRAGWRDPRRLLAIGWILCFLLAVCGVPGLRLLRLSVPLLDLVDFRRYPAASCELAAILLAALTVDDWQRAGRDGGRRFPMPATIAALIGFAILSVCFVHLAHARLAHGVLADAALRFSQRRALWLGSLAALVLSALLLRRVSASRLSLVLGITLADGLLAFMVPVLHGVALPFPPDLAPIRFLQAHQGLSRMHAVGQMLAPNYAGYFGLAAIDEMFLPVPNRWDAQVKALDPNQTGFEFAGFIDPHANSLIQNRAAYEAYAVRYVLISHRYDPLKTEPGFVRVFEDARTRVYELPGALPYLSADGCTLDIADRDHQRTTCARPSLLLRREMDFPGWHATIDGQKTAIATVAPGFQRVALPAGSSRIVWRYAPVDSRSIMVVFGAGLAALMLLLAVAAWPLQAAGLRRRSEKLLRNFATFGATTTRQ